MRVTLGLSCVLALIGLLASGCEEPCGDCGLTEAEWEVARTLSPLPPVPPDPTNRYQFSETAAQFGQRLFFEKGYSGAIRVPDNGSNGGLSTITGTTGKTACASCHDPKRYFVDTRSQPGNVSLAAAYTTRNSPSVVNLPYYLWWGLGGRHDSMWQQAALAVETPTDTNSDRCSYAHFMWRKYRDLYNSVFSGTPLPPELDPTHPEAARFPATCRPKAAATDPDGNWEKMAAEDKTAVLQILANQGKAVVAYETKLISGNSPFDRYMAGDEKAMTARQVRGLRLFIGKAACVDCHNTPLFSDSGFHNLGVPQEGPNVPKEDLGHFFDVGVWTRHPFNSASSFNDQPTINRVAGAAPKEEDKGKFRTPSLRNVAFTQPYMHNGALPTLAKVVAFYNQGGGISDFAGEKSARVVPLLLDEEEQAALVDFLEALTGDPIPPELAGPPPG